MNRTAKVTWKGSGLEGTGTITTQSGAFTDQPYGFKARFQSEDGKAGTNPEELLGAAHAACFSMALAFQLSNAGSPPTQLDTQAKVEMVKGDAGWSIPSVHLTVTGTVPGIDQAKFVELANVAKANCPVSKALGALTITLDAKLS
jgi:osmotically inducible protein OsmC